MDEVILGVLAEEREHILQCFEPGKQPLYCVETFGALLEAGKDMPELVVIDSQLPGFPEKGALKKLRSTVGDSQILLLVNGQNFDLACEAVETAVAAIIRKPCSKEMLQAALEGLRKKRERRKREEYASRFPGFIGQLFLNHSKDLPPEKVPDEDTVNTLYATQFQPDGYRLISICIESDAISEELLDTELLRQCISDIMKSTEEISHEAIFYIDHMRAQLLLNYRKDWDSGIVPVLEECLHRQMERLEPEEILTFCCSRMHGRIRQIQQMQEEASDAMWLRLTRGKGRVIISHQEPCQPELQQIFDNAEQRLITACSTLDLDAFQKGLGEFFSLPDGIVGRTETRRMIRRIEYYLQETNRDVILSFASASRTRRDIVLSLRSANTLQAYKQQYTVQLTALFQQILSHGQRSRAIRLAQAYIQKHYAEPLHLAEVAEHIGLSPAYLSALFKQEAGIGFSDYLNRCRIDAAKYLLRTTDEKILTVAAETGFSNPRYFSRVFRELERMKPTDYRMGSGKKA